MKPHRPFLPSLQQQRMQCQKRRPTRLRMAMIWMAPLLLHLPESFLRRPPIRT